MIDLHCHILPGIDDGAADLEDSLAMGRQADVDGIELVCATPHIRHDHPVHVGDIPVLVETLNGEYQQAGLAVRVAGGGEVAETRVDELSVNELRQLSLGGGRWILAELIAHPERHFDAGMPARLARLVQPERSCR